MAAVAPVVVIVGQTASGKTALALELARRFNGEIICADSRTVYREMNIGTAKPTSEEQRSVPHHIIDVVALDEVFTAADFQRLARQAVDLITRQGKLPIIVGGTGLYVDAFLYNYHFLPPNPVERRRLQTLRIEELQEEIRARHLPMPRNARNPRHLMRTLETAGKQSGMDGLRGDTLLLGLQVNKDELHARIRTRTEQMIERGLIEEVRTLFERYGAETEALRAPGYRAFYKYISGSSSLDEATEEFIKNDMALAKRQATWFRRNKSIHWVHEQAEAIDLLTTFLNKYHI